MAHKKPRRYEDRGLNVTVTKRKRSKNFQDKE